MVIAALWCGRDKPSFRLFLKAFVDEIQELSEEGMDSKAQLIIKYDVVTIVCSNIQGLFMRALKELCPGAKLRCWKLLQIYLPRHSS